MLEQASYCYLLSKPPMLHKYGFHLVLSGERYKKSDQVLIPKRNAKIRQKGCICRQLTCLFLSRLNMQFVHIKMPSLFTKKLHGAILRTMCISISDSKLQQLNADVVSVNCLFSLLRPLL